MSSPREALGSPQSYGLHSPWREAGNQLLARAEPTQAVGLRLEAGLLSRAHFLPRQGQLLHSTVTPQRRHALGDRAPSPPRREGTRGTDGSWASGGSKAALCSCGKSALLAGNLTEEEGSARGPSSRTRRKCLRKVPGVAIWLRKPQGLDGLLTSGSLVKTSSYRTQAPAARPTRPACE